MRSWKIEKFVKLKVEILKYWNIEKLENWKLKKSVEKVLDQRVFSWRPNPSNMHDSMMSVPNIYK